jgi:hypothetical protein
VEEPSTEHFSSSGLSRDRYAAALMSIPLELQERFMATYVARVTGESQMTGSGQASLWVQTGSDCELTRSNFHTLNTKHPRDGFHHQSQKKLSQRE